ncbi:MAG: DNA-directed RNA polymerase subunit B [Candidatus Aenigmatarchaeota archaeon]
MPDSQRYQQLLRAFGKDITFVNHQLASFNDFVDNRIQQIIDEIGEIELETPETAEFKIRLGKIRIPKPCVKEADGATRELTPAEARIRDLTYASPLFVEMIPIVNGIEQDSQEVKIGELPMMIKSNLCALKGLNHNELIEAGEDPTDPGGYFVINGTERVIIMVEEVLTDRPVVELKGDAQVARINSERKGYVQRHMVERKKGIIMISFANLKKLPIVILLRALGLKTDKELIETITKEDREMEEVYFNLYEFDVETVAQAREYIGEKLGITQKEYRMKRVDDILDKYLLPHLGQEKENRNEKALYIAKIVKKLIHLGLNKIEEQDIDHYANKRLKLNGDFLEILLRSVLLGKYGLMSRIVYRYQKLAKKGKIPTISSIVESDYLSKRIISHMATGHWVGGRTGVCQRLERNNHVRAVSHLRNIISPLSSAQEHFEARALHATHWGRLCAEQTPEGVNIGLRKYLATTAIISTQAPEKDLKVIADFAKKEEEGNYAIFLDGRVIKSIKKPEHFVNEIKHKRRMGLIDPMISIAQVDVLEEVHINTDAGRLERPVIVVENGKPLMNEKHIEKVKNNELGWNDLIKQGILEYLDAEEEEDALIAMDEENIVQETTHMEINPAVIIGIAASFVPFPEHNRGDRVNFGAKMSGQSLGIYGTNFLSRMDTRSNILAYPQKPLIDTIVSQELKFDQHPQGQNLVIAIMCYKGYNMEDSIILNQGSVDRGLGRSFFFRTYVTEEQKYWGIEKDEIKIPDKSVSGYRTEEAYINLAEDGIINRETVVNSGDVLVGKISPLRFFGPMENFMMESENRRETSEVIRHGEEGTVDNVILTQSSDGNKLVKIFVRSERVPEIGDKFASRHGQKGVVALLVPEEDIPFTEDGTRPDVIINTHAIPSRMTIGQLMEIIASKMSALSGKYIDGTVFNHYSEGELRSMLKSCGFRDDGKETMYDGITGKKLEAQILIGPCYYQKLHHMVADKIHSRARGPVALLTKQPTAGKAKQGGLRLGEMEKDCLIGHGAALLLKERFSSDIYEMPICRKCGLLAIHDRAKGRTYCPVCKKSKIVMEKMSYAFKLMLDELKAMAMYPKLNVKDEML